MQYTDEITKVSHVALLNQKIRSHEEYPVYIVDDYNIFNSDRERFIYLPCLELNSFSDFFTPTRRNDYKDAPVIFLCSSREAVEKHMQILHIAGVRCYFQDNKKPYEIIDAQDPLAAVASFQDQETRLNSAYYSITDFRRLIEETRKTPYIKTGFEKLDGIIGGGLAAGLYVIAAEPGAGKTSFCLQIADQISAGGHDVIYFSLEMSKFELIARSVSRLTFDTSASMSKSKLAKSEIGISDGRRYVNYSSEEKALIDRCITEYKETSGKHMFINESVGEMTPKKIREIIKERVDLMKELNMPNNNPVVILDYVQLIQSTNERAAVNDKLRIDTCITELKRLSRDYSIPIICISSVARDKYNAGTNKIDLNCFKESGSIEYTADVAAALVTTAEINEDTQKSLFAHRIVKLMIMKNRRGARWQEISYNYTPIFNHFVEVKQ